MMDVNVEKISEQRQERPWKEEDVITFPAGLPGFETQKRFVIVSVEEYAPFHWLQSIDGKNIRLAIINPLIFKPDYNPKISKEELSVLQIQDSKDLLMYVIVTIRQPIAESSANLMGPLFINIKERIGRQIIIEDNAYSLRAKII